MIRKNWTGSGHDTRKTNTRTTEQKQEKARQRTPRDTEQTRRPSQDSERGHKERQKESKGRRAGTTRGASAAGAAKTHKQKPTPTGHIA